MWRFSQSTGDLINNDGEVIATGYSGAPGFRNLSMMQDVKDKGPIPRGIYTIGDPVDTVTHGPFVLPLIPDPGNVMFNRDSFMLHGDHLEGPSGLASKGCPVFSRHIREKVWQSDDHQLEVII